MKPPSEKSERPVLKSKYIQTEDIREVIYMGLTGLYLYDYISSGRYCIESLDTYVTDLEMMTDALIDAFGYDPTNRVLYEYGLFNFTNSLGRFSPILRRCYTIGGEFDQNWDYFINQTSSVWAFYNMTKNNTIRNATDIDERGASLYRSLSIIDLPQASFDFFRLVFLFFLQTLTSTTRGTLGSPLSLQSTPILIPSTDKMWYSAVYPPDQETYSFLHLGAEYIYEFISGTRMSDQTTLDRCERNITLFSQEFDAAINYTKNGIDAQNFTIQREGVFRVADSLMRITNTTWQCYQVELLVEAVVFRGSVKTNVLNPLYIVINCAAESFYILSALCAQFANLNYQDWFSMSHWAGDLVYRTIVVDHSAYLDLF
ncbi:hypothetical protein FGO68_gene3100 [Halteria grandinella]|uniref:Uncharacterized protein n=1 Tax=Halteria grandinella TaxID=5974 RepID=A0A8J8NY70_HALGN|nr:hypothetical protein FGO68_gene3100 [Halteria grandinella]